MAYPITAAEDEFLNVVIYSFQTCLELGRSEDILSLPALELDARDFLGHPIPHAAWRGSRNRGDPEFVAFIDGTALS